MMVRGTSTLTSVRKGGSGAPASQPSSSSVRASLSKRLTRLLDDPRPNKQVILVTDGEPTAHLVDGHAWFNWPPIPETLEASLREAMRLARSQISLEVFLLEDAHGLVAFSERLAKVTGGSVRHLQGDALGRHILQGYDHTD
jgi:uncharacterized protein with von Willebrand factor type A (vWA) domain